MNRVILENQREYPSGRQGEEEKLLSQEESEFVLRDPEVTDHIISHLKAEVGSRIKVIVLGRGIGEATIKDIFENEVHLEVESLRAGSAQPYQLLVAASRPPTIKKVIEHGTSMGVREFIFFKADLSEKSYLTSKVFEKESLHQLTKLGLAQGAVFADRPNISIVSNLNEAIELAHGKRFILSLEAKNTFMDYNLAPKDQISLAIGPERGWTTQEEELLESQSFQKVFLGPSVLRVEIATFAALGQLAMMRARS